MKPAKPHPCASCPWSVENQGRTHPTDETLDYFYQSDTLAALWSGGGFTKPDGTRWNFGLLNTGLRDGNEMLCHGTDPNVVGHSAARKPRECAGLIVLQDRELLRAHDKGLRAYLRDHAAAGLTRLGIRRIAERMLGRAISLSRFEDVDRRELLDAAHPAVDDRGIDRPLTDH